MSILELSLTDERQRFVDSNCGDGTPYANAEEFVRDLLRERMARVEAAAIREGILEGYQDLLAGRVVEYQGDVRALIDGLED